MVDTTDDERLNIILEGVQSVGQISTSFGASPTEQKYKFAQRSFAGAKPDRTNVDLSLIVFTSRFAPSFERENFNGGVDLFHPRVYYI